jgi:hypothetical protein
MTEEEMKIFCFRDNLEGEKYRYFGVTLYFIEGAKNVLHVKPERLAGVSKAIAKIILADNPVVAFIDTCIRAGIGKTRCYFDARKAGVAIRKQNQLALYNYLLQKKPVDAEEAYAEIQANEGFYEHVQDYFADELSMYMGGMMYERSGLSKCEAPTEVEPGDFIFEIGRLQSGHIEYDGHYRDGGWLFLDIFDDFDTDGLERILDGR